MYSDPHLQITVKLNTGTSSLGTSFAEVMMSELVPNSRALDGKESELTADDVDAAFNKVCDTFHRLMSDTDDRFIEQVSALYGKGLKSVDEREAEAADASQA
jgi:hypothetical protein